MKGTKAKLRRNTRKRKLRKSRKFTLRGGAQIGEGTSGLVFNPPPCVAGSFGENEVGKVIHKALLPQEVQRIQEAFGRIPRELISTYSFYLNMLGTCDIDIENADMAPFFKPGVGADGSVVPPRANKDDYVVVRYAYAGEPLQKVLPKLTGLTHFKTHGALIKSEEEYNKELKYFFHSLHKLFYSITLLNEHGIIHRDIKPANITQQADKELTLIDFGILAFQDRPEEALFKQTNGYMYTYWPMEGPVVLDEFGFLNISNDRLQDFVDAILGGKILRDPTSKKYSNQRLEYHFKFAGISSEQRAEEIYKMVDSVKFICKDIITKNPEKYPTLAAYITDDTNKHFQITLVDRYVKSYLDRGKPEEGKALYDEAMLLKTDVRSVLYDYFDVFSIGILLLEFIHFLEKPENLKITLSPKNLEFMSKIKALALLMVSSNPLERGNMRQRLKDYESLEGQMRDDEEMGV